VAGKESVGFGGMDVRETVVLCSHDPPHGLEYAGGTPVPRLHMPRSEARELAPRHSNASPVSSVRVIE
jgi:hypothetical protein